MEISDENSILKENITIPSEEEFNNNYQKIILLKEKIENEIKTIDNLFDQTNNIIKNSFLNNHEKLIKEENDLIENLQNEVTKAKEVLENFWSLINNEMKICDKINKGIKKLEKEDKNIIKKLSYVSKMNKCQKGMVKLLNEFIKNIKFSYQEEKNIIKFDEY